MGILRCIKKGFEFSAFLHAFVTFAANRIMFKMAIMLHSVMKAANIFQKKLPACLTFDPTGLRTGGSLAQYFCNHQQIMSHLQLQPQHVRSVSPVPGACYPTAHRETSPHL